MSTYTWLRIACSGLIVVPLFFAVTGLERTRSFAFSIQCYRLRQSHLAGVVLDLPSLALPWTQITCKIQAALKRAGNTIKSWCDCGLAAMARTKRALGARHGIQHQRCAHQLGFSEHTRTQETDRSGSVRQNLKTGVRDKREICQSRFHQLHWLCLTGRQC